MSFLDKARAKLTDAVDKHGDKISGGLDKAADAVDKRTGGKHHDKIAGARGKARDALDKLDGKDDNDLGPDPRTDRPGRSLNRFVVVPAAYVFLVRGAGPGIGPASEVLLQLRQNTGFMDGHWAAAAAGHVERGETAYDAAQREAVEELDVRDLALEFVTAMQRTQHADPIDERIDFFFTARAWTGEPRILEPAKCAELRWCRLDGLADLPGPVVPHELVVMTGLRAGYVPSYTFVGFDRTVRPEREAP